MADLQDENSYRILGYGNVKDQKLDKEYPFLVIQIDNQDSVAVNPIDLGKNTYHMETHILLNKVCTKVFAQKSYFNTVIKGITTCGAGPELIPGYKRCKE
jgi:hypothetical protein